MSWLIDIVHRDLSTTVSIIATSLIALSLLGWKVTRRGPHWVGLVLRSGLFALLTAAVTHLVGSPLEPVFVAPGSAMRGQRVGHLELGLRRIEKPFPFDASGTMTLR